VKPAPFEYFDPRTVDEVVERLAQGGDDAKILAGGQSLMPMLALRLARPAAVIDVNRVAGLDGLTASDGTLRLGALVRQRALERWARTHAPLFAAVLRLVGHVAIRTRGTVAGSVTHADPAAELPALFRLLDGVALARSRRGERTIAARDLFAGPLTTSLRSDEVVVETRWAMPPPHAGWGFHEVARRHGDFALVGAVAVVTVARGRIDGARLALFGAGPTPVRAAAAEKALIGVAPAAGVVADAARLAAETLDPDTDLHATAHYRKRVARTLAERALTDALARAKATA
jgi:CO/xanthine dehydrogenase FAD-binding subunit